MFLILFMRIVIKDVLSAAIGKCRLGNYLFGETFFSI